MFFDLPVILALLVWFVSGFLTVGAMNAEAKNRWPSIYRGRETLGECMMFGMMGPVGLLVTFLGTGFFQYGLDWDFSQNKEPK